MTIGIVCGVGLLATLLLPPESARGQNQDEQLDGKKADVMFVLDVTGSMQFAIDGVEQGLEKIVNKLKKNDIDATVGLTVFRDRAQGNGNKPTPNDLTAGIKGDPFTFTFKGGSAFTDSQRDFRAVVAKLKAEGGGDIPENSIEGMKHAAAARTRKGVSRIMILITDAPPHPGATLAKRIGDTRENLVSHKYHHLYLMCRPDDRALYQSLWCEVKGHRLDGVFFPINNQPAAFAGILEEVSDRAVADLIKRRARAGAP